MTNAQQAIIANATAPPPPEEKHKLQKFIEIPKFSAKPTENFQQWVYESSKAIKILKYSDEDAFDIVGFKLSGGPYDTHRHFYEEHLKKNNIPKFSEFLKLLTIKYGNELEIQQAREKLLCLKMSNHGNDILRYNEAFDALISKIGYTEFSQNELLANYKHGLSQQIHKEINLRRANDLTEAISIAIQYSQLNSNDQYSMNYAGREINRSYINYNNNYIKKPNNYKIDNRSKGTTRNYNNKEGNNFQPRRNFNGNNNYKSGNNYAKPRIYKGNEVIECFNCKEKGHIKRNCPKLRQVNNMELTVCTISSLDNTIIPNSMVNVEDIPIRAFFDTGAECSIMSLETFKKHGFEFQGKSNITIRTASDQVIQPEGQTPFLNVELGNVTVKIQFIVMKHKTHPILLGMDWFSEARATITPADNYITFNSRRVLTKIPLYNQVFTRKGKFRSGRSKQTSFINHNTKQETAV